MTEKFRKTVKVPENAAARLRRAAEKVHPRECVRDMRMYGEDEKLEFKDAAAIMGLGLAKGMAWMAAGGAQLLLTLARWTTMDNAFLRKMENHFAVMDVSFIGQLGHNSLTDTTMVMDQEKPEGGVPNTFVPGRNLFFLSIAAVYARERGINHLVTGVSQTDFSGYPDCRDAFIKSLNVTLNLAMDEQFVIHTPLMWIDKAQTWALAETLTCYNGIPGDGCGHCPACKLRREGLEKYLAEKQQK